MYVHERPYEISVASFDLQKVAFYHWHVDFVLAKGVVFFIFFEI